MNTKTVLFADDDTALARAFALRCRELGVRATTSPDGLHAFGAILHQPPDLLVLDVNMPAADGLNMCEELARDQRFAPIPVIILTGSAGPEAIERCRRLGAHYVQKGAGAWDALRPLITRLLDLHDEPRDRRAEQPALRGAPLDPCDAALEPQGEPRGEPRGEPLNRGGTPLDLRADPLAPRADCNSAPAAADVAPNSPPAAPRVLSIDDDPDISLALQVRLRAYGVEVLRAFSGMQGYWTALKEMPNVIIMDYQMPEGCGDYLLGRLKNHSITRDIPIIVLSGQTVAGRPDRALERELIGLGAAAYFCKPMDFDALLRELRVHIHLKRPPSPIPVGAV